MNCFELAKALVNIESVTGHEKACAEFLRDHLATREFQVEMQPVSRDRANLFACWGAPDIVLSTHIDTVPPWVPAREDDDFVYGRGSCDAKGIIAAQVVAAEHLIEDGVRDFALLFLVGEETTSDGAREANLHPRGSRYIINGEPTENKLVIATKGNLRLDIRAQGKMAHSAYPELGESAIEALLDALEAIRQVPLPKHDLLGPCTMNIGTIAGGRAPNVIADAAKAEILVRLVDDPAPIREAFARAVGTRAQLKEILCIPAIRFASVDSLPTTVVSYTTDVPVFGRSWGEPLLLGPGSIHVAHTAEERIAKHELAEAVRIYADVVKKLLATA